MSTLVDALTGLAPAHDPEMREGYERYEALLAAALPPEQLADYAAYIQQSGEIRILEELSADEVATLPPAVQAVAAACASDMNIAMENRRVVALLNQRGEHTVAPDLDGPDISHTDGRVSVG